MHLGINLWPQNTTWQSLREHALLADRLGFDSLWVWDHFYSINGDLHRPNLEGWQLQAAYAAITKNVRIGCLVSGVTHRHPAVLANMAADSWVPHQYRYLSTRLVTQKGIQLMGLAAFGILVVTGGRVALLVVLYSINVFLTFSLSLLGLCIYWWRARRGDRRWLHRIALSCLGLLVTGSILLVTLVEKFTEGGWMTVVITGVVIAFCLLNHAHYKLVRRKIRAADEALGWIAYPEVPDPPPLDPRRRPRPVPLPLWLRLP